MTPREMAASDRPFVVSTWGNSSSYKGMRRRQRFALVDRVLDAGAPVIVLANGPTIHAWACGRDGVLHFAYLPPELRGKGLGAKAIALAVGGYFERINVTHEWPGESRRFRYTPHLLHREPEAA